MKKVQGLLLANIIFFIFNFYGIKLYPQDTVLTYDDKHDIISKIIIELNGGYIYPETASRIESYLLQNFDNNKYGNIFEPEEFVSVITKELRKISKDKHLHVDYFRNGVPKEKSNPEEMTITEVESKNEFEESADYGFKNVKILKGNVGYFELTGFMNPAHSTDMVADVFNFLANTKALIIDVRKNEGGNPYMVQLISSYLLDEGILLNSIYWRNRQTTDDFYTLSYLKGKKYMNNNVYILTSEITFSAAEEFAYNLQVLKRAIIIGETTAGGANPGIYVKLSDNFGMFLPTGTSINPITKTNWEGTGVIPDILTSKEDALKVAKKQIVNNLKGILPR